ncbi:Regulator of chromosome condensation, RCC1, partial [Candidatus Magnetomorum sp. HK-1]
NNITMFAAGEFNSIALKNDGTVWIWGQNIDSGGSIIYIDTPTQVSGLNNVTSIACGTRHYFALKNDGTVWAWGRNTASQLGDGTDVYKYSPVQLSNLNDITILYSKYIHSFAQKADGTVWGWGYNGYGQLGDGTTTTRDVPISIEFGVEPPPTTNEDTPYTTTYNITDAESGTCGLIITMASSDSSLFTNSNFTYTCDA